MDPINIQIVTEVTKDAFEFGQGRLDCENLDDMTVNWEVPNKPSFMTVLLRFFGNIFVDCFRSIFE